MRRLHILLLALVAVVVASTAGAITYVRYDQPSQEDKLISSCRAALLGQLRAPAGTRWIGDERVVERSPGSEPYSWKMSGHADVQAITGVLVRASWTCIANWRAGEWHDAGAWVEQ